MSSAGRSNTPKALRNATDHRVEGAEQNARVKEGNVAKAQQRENVLTSARAAMEPGPGAWDRKAPWDKTSGSRGWYDPSHAGSSQDDGWTTNDGKKNRPKVGSPAPSWADQSDRSETLMPWRADGDDSELKQ